MSSDMMTWKRWWKIWTNDLFISDYAEIGPYRTKSTIVFVAYCAVGFVLFTLIAYLAGYGDQF